MNRITIAMVALVAFGCAAAPEEKKEGEKDPNVITMSDAIDDYIEVAELEEVHAVRSLMQLYTKVLSDRYILIYDNRRNWLAAYNVPCKELYKSHGVQPDIRYERNTVRAKFDTYRGCKIDRIYSISDGVVQELETLGKAPGEA